VQSNSALSQSSGSPANPTQPLAATEGAIRLRSVHNPVSRALYLAGAVTVGALPGASAFLIS